MEEVLRIINKKGPIDERYLAGLGHNMVALHAHSLAAAKQKALEHFRPKKKQRELVWVRLANED